MCVRPALTSCRVLLLEDLRDKYGCGCRAGGAARGDVLNGDAILGGTTLIARDPGGESAPAATTPGRVDTVRAGARSTANSTRRTRTTPVRGVRDKMGGPARGRERGRSIATRRRWLDASRMLRVREGEALAFCRRADAHRTKGGRAARRKSHTHFAELDPTVAEATLHEAR